MSTPEQIGTEVAKGIGEAVKEVALNLLGPASTEAGLFVGDIMAQWRASNLVKIYEKFRTNTKGKSLPEEAMSRLPFGFRALFVEEASKVEDSELQQLWANLLSTSLEKGEPNEYQSYFADLKKLTPLSVRILKLVRAQPPRNRLYRISIRGQREVDISSWQFDAKLMSEIIATDSVALESGLSTLIRLQFVSPIPDAPDVSSILGASIEAEELANAVSRVLEDYVASIPDDPEKGISRIKFQSSEVIYFDVTLSRYGRGFLAACASAS